jgi:hypothetical protein
MAATEPKLGVSMFSFTDEWRLGRYDLESLLARLDGTTIGPGFEIVGKQTIRGYPRVDENFAHEFRRLMDKYRRVPTCLGANTDVLRRRGQPMTDVEKADDLIAQMRVAHKLGFPVMRIQIGLSQAVLEPAAAEAERLKLKLGMEIHAPQGSETPMVKALREVYQRIGSPNLGFIPDFSSTMRAVPAGQITAFMKQGLSASLASKLVECWSRDDLDIDGRFADFQRAAAADGASPELIAGIRISFHMFGRQPVETWRPLMSQVFHVHAKFYEIDAAGNEPSIPYSELLPLFRAGGYQAYFSSEWEGGAFTLSTDVNAIELVERQHTLMRRVWSTAIH